MFAALQLIYPIGKAEELSQKPRLGQKMPGQVLDWKKPAVNDGMHWGKSKVRLRLASAQLIAKNDDGITTNYLVDKNRDYGQVLKELDSANTETVSYLYGDDLIKQTRASNDSYYLYDGHGSARALSDAAGSIRIIGHPI